jgi:hypothetical protein
MSVVRRGGHRSTRTFVNVVVDRFSGTTALFTVREPQEFDLATVQAPKKKKADDPNNQDEEQIVPLANERFMVPETLFHPSDIGVNQMGIAEALVHAVRIHLATFAARILGRACTQRPRPRRSSFDIGAAELQTDGQLTRGGGERAGECNAGVVTSADVLQRRHHGRQRQHPRVC